MDAQGNLGTVHFAKQLDLFFVLLQVFSSFVLMDCQLDCYSLYFSNVPIMVFSIINHINEICSELSYIVKGNAENFLAYPLNL